MSRAPKTGRRPGYVLYAPWRGFLERPWFDALFVFGVWPMARRRKKSPNGESSSTSLAFPFDAVMWDRVMSALGLAPQEARAVERILRGMSDKQIALDMKIGEPTLRTYLTRVFRHVGVDDRVQLVLRVFAEARSLANGDGHQN